MSPTAVEQSLDIVRTFREEVFNDREYDRIPELQAEDYVQHGPLPGMELRGTEASEESLRMFHGAFPDLEAVEEVAFSDGEYVCAYLTYRGTHDGEFMGLPPTGVEGAVGGTIIDRIEDGKIAEVWALVDFLGLLQQLGVVPSLEEMGA